MRFQPLSALALVFASVLSAQAPVNPSLYQDLEWRFIGPFRGGRVLTVAGIPGDDRHFYFGSVGGGVWATEDAGRTWHPLFDGQDVASIGDLALAPSDPKTIYVGTGEADMRSDIAHGNGLYKSVDGGAHWSHMGLEDTYQIGRVLVDPKHPDTVLVAALGHAYGPNAERGVFRSTDGGVHWTKVLFRDENTGAIDLAFKPGDPSTVYAALWQTRRPPWSVYPPSSGPGSGLFISRDGGLHWSEVKGSGFPAHPGRMGIAVAPSDPDRVYVLVDAPKGEGGLYRSDDGGSHWQHLTGDSRLWQRGWYFCRLTVDPQQADRLYVMNTIVLRSEDGGKSFLAMKGDPTGDDFHQMWIDPTNADRQILGTDQGTLITLNGGKTWSSWRNQPTAQIYHVATDNQFPYWVYGAQQDSGAVALPSRGNSMNGITLQQFHEITAGGESGMIAPDPEDPHLIFGDRVDKLDTRSGQTRSVDPTLAYPADHYRGAWTLPLAFSKEGPKTLYFANQRIFRTMDGGEHWIPISPDLTREDPGIPANLDPVTAKNDSHVGPRRGVVYALETSPLNGQVLWAGTDDGRVWRTDNGGADWQEVTPKGITSWSKITGISLSPFNAQVAYLAVDRHRLDDDAPYCYRTEDGGRTWQRRDQGIPRNAFLNVVRADPQQQGLLYAGTEKGVYVSFNDGSSWQSLQQNLPMTSVRDLTFHDDDLVIATHGRGFWIMDKAKSLRQVSAAKADAVTLFRPSDAVRVRIPFFTGTPFPKDEPMAANPPEGAIVDYALPPGVGTPVTLKVLDAQGQVVRSFSSADKVEPPDPAKLGFAPEWVPTPSILATTPGMHRFVWDLRYPAPSLEGTREREGRSGIWAPPGRYTLELEAAGVRDRQPLEVLPDPRVPVPVAALKRQFELATRIQDALVRASGALAEAEAALKDMRKHQEAPSNNQGASTKASQSPLIAKVAALSGLDSTGDPREGMERPPLRTDSLRALITNLAKLGEAVDGADADPSPDARAAYHTLTTTLDATLSEWVLLQKEIH